MSFFVIGSSKVRPMRRLIAKKVLSGFVTAWRFAGWPTSLSPSSVKATIEGVVRAPSAFSITLGLDPSITATQELVVPRSMPIILPIIISLSRAILGPEAALSGKCGRRLARARRAIHSAACPQDCVHALFSQGLSTPIEGNLSLPQSRRRGNENIIPANLEWLEILT